MTAQVIDFVSRLAARRAMPLAVAVETVAQENAPALDTHFKGSKYTQGLSAREIPALIRADIKAAKAASLIHRDVKVSVRFESYSGGCAIRVQVTQVPTGFVVENPAFAAAWEAHEKAHANCFDYEKFPRYTKEAQSLQNTVSALVVAYQKREDDSQTDYWYANFHGGDVQFSL